MRKIKALVLTMLCLHSIQGMGASVMQSNSIKLATGDNYFPFVSSKLPNGGWSQALIQAIFEKMGNKLEIDVLPWARGYKWALNGQYTGTFPYVYTEVRSKQFLYSKPINYVPIRIYVASVSPISSIDDLRNKTLCLPHGYVLDPSSAEVFKHFKLRISHAIDAVGCAGQVLKRWSDFGLINGYFTEKKLVQRFGSLDAVRIIDQELAYVPLYFIVSKKTIHAKQIIQRFNETLDELEKSGEKSKIDKMFLSQLALSGHESIETTSN